MGQKTHIREVYSRIYRMAKITIGKYGLFYFLANILGTGIYFLIQSARLGKAVATENLLDGLILLGAINVSLFVLAVPYIRFWVIPEEIYNNQEHGKETLKTFANEKEAEINRLENQIIDLQKKLNERDRYIAEYDRKARADSITLSKADRGSWIGIKIHNGEVKEEFRGRLLIAEIPQQREFSPVEAKVENSAETIFSLLPGESIAVRVVDIGNPDMPGPSVSLEHINSILLDKSGEYVIKIRLKGKFSESGVPVSFQRKWVFISNIEDRKFDFVQIGEE